MLRAALRRSKCLIQIKALAGINQIARDRLGKVGVRQVLGRRTGAGRLYSMVTATEARLAAFARSRNAGSGRSVLARDGLRNGAFGADKFGLKDLNQCTGTWVRRSSINIRCPQAKPCCPPMARSVPTPANSPAAARRISSRSVMPPPGRRCGGPAISRSRQRSSTRSMRISSSTPKA